MILSKVLILIMKKSFIKTNKISKILDKKVEDFWNEIDLDE